MEDIGVEITGYPRSSLLEKTLAIGKNKKKLLELFNTTLMEHFRNDPAAFRTYLERYWRYRAEKAFPKMLDAGVLQ